MKSLIPAGIALMLVACTAGDSERDQDGGDTVDAEDPLDPTTNGVTAAELESGLWEWTLQPQNVRFEEPMTEEREEMRRELTQPVTDTICLLPDQVANPVPRMFQGMNEEDGCDYTDFEMANGELSYAARCQGDGMGGGTLSVEGDYTSVSYNLEIRGVIETGPLGRATMTGRLFGRRVEDCDVIVDPGPVDEK